jgi:diacylglycerol kinase family enzyme
MVFLGLNSLQLEKLQLEIAECVKDQRLAVIAPKPLSRWSLLWLALKGSLGRLNQPEELLCRCASHLSLSWVGHSRGRVAVDGESFECKMPLEVEVMPGALKVIVPRTPEKRE